MAEALAPTTHPADVVGQQAGARSGQARGGEDPPNPRHVYAAKARLRRLVPFLVGDVLVEVNKALKALVEWTTQHWGEDVELVGEEDLEPMNMNHHDSFGFGRRGDQVRGWHDGRGRADGEGAASAPTTTTGFSGSTPEAPAPELNRRRRFTSPSSLDQDD